MNNHTAITASVMAYTTRRLKQLRTLHGFTQKHVADSIGIEKKMVYQYEKGLLMPSLRTLIKLCVLYDTTPNSVLGFQNKEGIHHEKEQ